MVAAAFPLAKLLYLAIKQISKPLANQIKNGAKRSPFFRTYICMPPAQLYHWSEVNIKMKMLNLGSPTQVSKLNEAMAIELGADILGESTIFIIGAACLLFEYMRTTKNSDKKEAELQHRLGTMEDTIFELEFRLGEQTARLQELNREVHHRHSLIKRLVMRDECSADTKGHVPKSGSQESLIDEAIKIADNAIKSK